MHLYKLTELNSEKSDFHYMKIISSCLKNFKNGTIDKKAKNLMIVEVE